jgi:hypothetical protein
MNMPTLLPPIDSTPCRCVAARIREAQRESSKPAPKDAGHRRIELPPLATAKGPISIRRKGYAAVTPTRAWVGNIVSDMPTCREEFCLDHSRQVPDGASSVSNPEEHFSGIATNRQVTSGRLSLALCPRMKKSQFPRGKALEVAD